MSAKDLQTRAEAWLKARMKRLTPRQRLGLVTVLLLVYHVAWIKGERVVFIIRIEGAEYIYEWGFDKKNAFLLNKNN